MTTPASDRLWGEGLELPLGLSLLDAVETVARDHGVGPASVALAWLREQPQVVAPLASATSVAQLDELVASARVELSAAELDRLTEASAALG
jgi:aryl-alcohol dehydrogenase-like predicted oxidoreductase